MHHRHAVTLAAALLILALTACSSTSKQRFEASPAPAVTSSPFAGMPQPPDPETLRQALTNKNVPSSPMGKACWAQAELSFVTIDITNPMVGSTPVVPGPISSNADRERAAVSVLSQIRDVMRSAEQDLPPQVRPFAARLVAQTNAALATLKTPDGRIPIEALRNALMRFFDQENYPNARDYVAAAKNSPDCARP
jgi:hypothetical protein